MPIKLSQPVTLSVPVTTQQEVTCNHQWLMSLATDASRLAFGPVTAEIVLLPYFDGPPPIFASADSISRRATKDLYAGAANLAANGRTKIAQAMDLVFAGSQEWDDEMREREAIQATAQETADQANSAATNAANSLDTARLNLFAALHNATYENGEAKNAAVAAAQSALDTATDALNSAQQKQALANETLQNAAFAAQDVANPRFNP